VNKSIQLYSKIFLTIFLHIKSYSFLKLLAFDKINVQCDANISRNFSNCSFAPCCALRLDGCWITPRVGFYLPLLPSWNYQIPVNVYDTLGLMFRFQSNFQFFYTLLFFRKIFRALTTFLSVGLKLRALKNKKEKNETADGSVPTVCQNLHLLSNVLTFDLYKRLNLWFIQTS